MSSMDLGTRAPKFAIPDDSEQSTYRFIIVAAKRARQLQQGARSFLPTTAKKPTVIAIEEVRRGLVKYDDPVRDGTSEDETGADLLEESI
jgi:DNA-directed RNA polymerase subunit omega